MSITVIVLGVLCSMVFGRVIGNKGAQIWEKKENKGVLPWLLFPISAYNNSVGVGEYDKITLVDEEGYRTLMTFFWPVKAVINPILWTAIGVWEAVKLVWKAMRLVGDGADLLSKTIDAGIQQATNGLGALRAHKGKKARQLNKPDPQHLLPDWEEECEALANMEREMEALGEKVAAKRKDLAKLTPNDPYRCHRKK